LRTGTKTKKPINHAAAKKIYDKLVKGKMAKGYTPGEDGSLYVHTDADSRYTGIHCQLLNFVNENEIAALINDEAWWAQKKHDGKRMLIDKKEVVTAVNRKGLSVGAPKVILDTAAQIEQAYLIDGEAVGEKLFAFDLLELGGQDIRSMPYEQRISQLEGLGLDGAIVMVKTAVSIAEKQQLYDHLQQSGAEGIVFKKRSAPYTTGRPNSGGAQVKFKFYATASLIVTKINNKRSVAVAVMDGENQVDVGNVTIPPNKEVPPLNAFIEARYLYAYKGGSLYQPTYLGVRDDIGIEDCPITQLKYKRE